MAWTYAVFTVDGNRPIAFQAVRHSARDLPKEQAEAERERLQAEYEAEQAKLPEAERRPLRFEVWLDRALPADEGFTPETWKARHQEPVNRTVSVKGIGPPDEPHIEPTLENLAENSGRPGEPAT